MLILIIIFIFAITSSSLDSPATSMQDMATGGPAGRSAPPPASALVTTASSSSEVGGIQPAITSHSFPTTIVDWDSDFETEPEPPSWRDGMTKDGRQDELNQLNPREKKRQDVINGNFLV